jgi:hypothetical protein
LLPERDEKIRRVIAYGLSQDGKCQIWVKKKRLDPPLKPSNKGKNIPIKAMIWLLSVPGLGLG